MFDAYKLPVGVKEQMADDGADAMRAVLDDSGNDHPTLEEIKAALRTSLDLPIA